MSTIYLVSCVGRKRTGRNAAKDLYLSSWFVKARAYVERQHQPWFILSALYGLVNPETQIDAYDKTLNDMSVAARRQWAETVWAELRKLLKPKDTVVFLAGNNYRQFLMAPLREAGVAVDVPMQALRIGQQLQWLDRPLSDR